MAVEIIGSTAGAGSFVLDLVRCLAAPIGRPFKYLWNYNTNFINLEKEVDKLKDARVKVQRKVDAAINNVEEIEETVEKWQKDVDSIIGEAEQLIQEKANNPHCFKGLCPNWITHYKHSKKAFKLKENDISLELDKESEVADKANKLYARLKMSKKDEKGMRPVKILLILDNIWKDLDLTTVGIPSGDDRGGCKLLLTTRVRDVLDRMGSTNNFKMGTLNDEEAWNLFQKMAVMALLQDLSYGLM
ncbi:hypothetical protein Pint_17177 [Pistacia integerrima]|uniref:Uncharacterized protein n=1 Tax=Pistacia integerrima TaxID=434235 RepID=A0ACC0Z1A6_9ROSI|nr:hypothetical protein Pint_17177 [Pistacia integerrima]